MTQQEQIEYLIKPRYKVIADYPQSDFKINEIVLLGDNRTAYGENQFWGTDSFELFPAIFKEIFWWENREISEMPEYVKVGEKIVKVKKWLFQPIGVWLNLDYPDPSFTMGNKFYPSVLPATQEDYNNYLNQTKQP